MNYTADSDNRKSEYWYPRWSEITGKIMIVLFSIASAFSLILIGSIISEGSSSYDILGFYVSGMSIALSFPGLFMWIWFTRKPTFSKFILGFILPLVSLLAVDFLINLYFSFAFLKGF